MRTKKGLVVSNKMEKTIVVEVTSYKTHPKYKKRYKVSNKFYAHDEKSICNMGDTVSIKEVRPISKLKRWIVIHPESSN